MSAKTETAILAGGCFWPAQELLRRRAGVISTCVGYTGGENDNPTANHHPGHAEAVKVVFDPGRTSYRAILEFFLQIHRPDLGEEHVGCDYRSEIFCSSDKQRRVAENTLASLDATEIWPGKIVTKISDAGPFWPAEEAPGVPPSLPRNQKPGEQVALVIGCSTWSVSAGITATLLFA